MFLGATDVNPYDAGGFFGQHEMMQKTLKNDWNPGTWVLIWKYLELSNEYHHDRV